MNKTFKIRTRFLVNRGFQFQVVRLVLFQTLFTSLLLIGFFYALQKSHAHFLASIALDSEKIKLVSGWTDQMALKMVGIVAFACLFQCLLAFIISHRIAGPMHRLKRYLGEISQGVPQQLQFRRQDQFQDVQDAYNEMVVVLEKERQNDLRLIGQLEDGIHNLKKMIKDEQTFQVAEYIERLTNDLKNFKTH